VWIAAFTVPAFGSVLGAQGVTKQEPLVFASVTAGEDFTCALIQEGQAYCWGRNSEGQLGDGSRGADRLYAAPVEGIGRFTALSAGDAHVCAVTTFAWVNC
jgi:alpha-tubulin suppressor-like RCC1 family protein